MNATELTTEVAVLKENNKWLRGELDKLAANQTRLEAALADAARDNAVLRQRLDELVKRADAWAGRLWALVAVLVGAV